MNLQQIKIIINKVLCMSRCIHSEQIKYFCMKPDCQYNNPGGCLNCFKKDHKHNDEGELLQIDQLMELMTKYSFTNKIKPQCVNLQESFYSYFKKIQTELSKMYDTIDQICKNVINTIGFPYICYKNNFTVYKRIKNKQFNKLSTIDFQKFVNDTRSTPSNKLAESQQKLYIKQVNNAHQMIKQIDYLLASFQNLTKYYDQKTKFTHDNSQYMANKQIVEKIKSTMKPKGNNTSISNNISQQLTGKHNGKTQEKNRRVVTQQQEPKNKMINSDIQLYSKQVQNKNIQMRKSAGKYQVFVSGLKQEQNNGASNLVKNQEKELPKKRTLTLNINNQNNDKGRRVSIDTHLVKNKQKLEQKASKIRQSLHTEQQQESEDVSKQRIKNNNLPAQQQKSKNYKPVEDVQIVPITRKLEEKLYQNQLQEVQSPLLKNKFKAKIRKLSQDSEKQNPKIMGTPEKLPTTPKTQLFQIKPEKVTNTSLLPELTEDQQRSFLFLTASFKLQTGKAIPILEKALQECNKNLSAVQYLSFLYLQSNQFLKCLKLCDKYLYIVGNNKSLTQSRILLLNNKSSALNNLGRYSQTVKLLQKQAPEDESLLKNLGNAYYGLGYLQQAIKVYQKTLTLCNDDQIYYNLSGCLYLIKQFQAAKVSIESALAFQPMKKQYLQMQMHIKSSIKGIK